MQAASIVLALAAATLLPGCVSPLDYDQRVPKTPIYQQLQAQLRSQATPQPARLEQLQHLVRVTLSEDALFPDGGATLNEAGKTLLARMAPALKNLSEQRVVVKGFTDNVPLGPELPVRLSGNVELSNARAGAVADYLGMQGVPSSIIYDSGLGETHPVADNDTPQGRAKNRRVEIDIVQAPA